MTSILRPYAETENEWATSTDWNRSLTTWPTFTVKAPDCGPLYEPLGYVTLKLQNHCCAVTITVTSGFCGIVSVITRVWKAATPTMTRMIAGMIVQAVSSLRSCVLATTGPVVCLGRTRNLRTAYATSAMTKTPIAT